MPTNEMTCCHFLQYETLVMRCSKGKTRLIEIYVDFLTSTSIQMLKLNREN